jgi:hypothetical protein
MSHFLFKIKWKRADFSSLFISISKFLFNAVAIAMWLAGLFYAAQVADNVKAYYT